MGAACDLRGPGWSTKPTRRAIRMMNGSESAVIAKAADPLIRRIQVILVCPPNYRTALISFFIASAAAATAFDQRFFANWDFQGSFSYAKITLRDALQMA